MAGETAADLRIIGLDPALFATKLWSGRGNVWSGVRLEDGA